MVGLVDAARLMWCQGLAQATGKPSQSIQTWLASATYAPSISGKALTLGGVNKSDLLMAIGYDINRLSSAASETLRNIAEIPGVPKSLAWPYVKIYYSALFYAHVILRIWGRSPTYFRTSDLLHLRNTVNAYSLTSPFPLNTGQFIVLADAGTSQITIAPDKGGGGTHEAIWRELNRALIDLKGAVSASHFLNVDKATISAQVDLAIDLMTNGGANPAWPSYMRNEIHYRQAAGVWHPYKGRAKTSELSSAISKVLTPPPDAASLLGTVGDDLVRFRSTCMFVITFARQILLDLSTIGGPKTFLNYGQTQFEAAYP